MEQIKTWISGICAVSLMISILKSLLPESAVGKTFNVAASLIVILAIIMPIKKFDFDSFELVSLNYEKEISDKIEKAVDDNDKITDRIIEKKLAEYVCNKSDVKLDDIKITCDRGEIISVELSSENEAVKEILIKECGVDEKKIIKRGA